MQLRVILEPAVMDRRSGVERRQRDRVRASALGGRIRPEGDIRRAADRVPLEIRWDLEGWRKEIQHPEELFERLMHRLAAALARTFAVEPPDVAILLLKDKGKLLRFAYPSLHYLGKTNFFPIGMLSIAGEVLATGKARIDNDLSLVRHLDIYERIRGKEEREPVIQKMVTAPLLLPRGKALGVVQVSRRGPSQKEAGADFPPFDLLKLRDLSRGVAPVILDVIPETF